MTFLQELYRDIDDMVDLKLKHDAADLREFVMKQDVKFDLMHLRYVDGLSPDEVYVYLYMAIKSRVIKRNFRVGGGYFTALIELWGESRLTKYDVHIFVDSRISHERAVQFAKDYVKAFNALYS